MNKSEAGRLGYVKSASALAAHVEQMKATARAKADNANFTCKGCGKPLPYEKRRNIYCSHSCSGRSTNAVRNEGLHRRCDQVCWCGAKFTAKKLQRSCSKTCSKELEFREYIARWLAGDASGGSWARVSFYVRRWLIERYGEKCCRCGWCERHPVTGKVPVQVDYKDGDGSNHHPDNLHLLCPNCHSLTPTFAGLNRGHGRYERRARYKKITPPQLDGRAALP